MCVIIFVNVNVIYWMCHYSRIYFL